MLKLIQLELKKNGIRSNIRGAFIAIFIILACITGDSFQEPLPGYNELFSLINFACTITFIIFASVLLSKLVIDEFKNKTITVLFMYPVQRKKVLTAKLIIVVVFTFIFSLLAKIIILSGFYFINQYTHFIQEELTLEIIRNYFVQGIINSITASCISLVPLFFGMRKYSTASTIVSAVIISSLLNSQFGSDFTLSSIIYIPLAIAIIGVLIGFMSIRNIENKDIV
ncbi:ABC-2 family transporter protein [compost metagenome]